VAAQVRASIAAAVSEFKIIRQVAALSRANRGVNWAFLLFNTPTFPKLSQVRLVTQS